MAKDKLDGSFSGLWTCELCGKTGTECTCEHFARNGTARSRGYKTLTDAEIMAEYWRGELIKYRAGITRDSLVWESIVSGTDYRDGHADIE